MIDEKALYNDLLEIFVAREYADRFGIIECNFREKAVEKYRNDPIFHGRVKLIIACIMDLVNKHEKI